MKNHIVVVVVLAIVIVGGWFLFNTSVKAPAPEESVTSQVPTIDNATPETVVENAVPEVTVAYTDQGFSPKEITIVLGTKVTFVNQSTKNMWVASAKHPDHTVYSGTSLSQHCPDTTNSSFDECTAVASGSSFSFTFSKEGSWKYHNHTSASDFGSVTVTAATSSTQI